MTCTWSSKEIHGLRYTNKLLKTVKSAKQCQNWLLRASNHISSNKMLHSPIKCDEGYLANRESRMGKCERAMLMHEQHQDFGFPIADIAVHFQCSKGDVEMDLRALNTQRIWIQNRDEDTSKFSFFSKIVQRKSGMVSAKQVRGMITSTISEGRIPSVAVRGGLRDFASSLTILLSWMSSNKIKTLQ